MVLGGQGWGTQAPASLLRMDVPGRHVDTYLKSQRNGAPVAFSSDLDGTPYTGFSPSLSLPVTSLRSEYLPRALLQENPTQINPTREWAPPG